MDEGFRTFDHTGDLGLEAWAGSPERLYALAVLGVLAQVAEAPGHVPEVEVHLALSAADPGDLLVDLCNAALLEAEVRGAVWTDARVTRVGPQGLEATLSGPRRDPRRQVFLREIKAVSDYVAGLR